MLEAQQISSESDVSGAVVRWLGRRGRSFLFGSLAVRGGLAARRHGLLLRLASSWSTRDSEPESGPGPRSGRAAQWVAALAGPGPGRREVAAPRCAGGAGR